MTLELDLYRSVEGLETSLQSLNSDPKYRIKDVKDISNFINDLSAQGIKPNRLHKYVCVLGKLSTWTSKPLVECRKEELMELVRKIDLVKNYSDWTKHDRKVILKRFYRWVNGDEEHPQWLKWLKLSEPKNKILPEELLTEEEIIKIIESSNYVRDKAFVATLFESGCRIGEILTLQIKNVSFGEHITSLIVCGKTGQRRVPLITSTSYLSTWLSVHPQKNNPNAPLWMRLLKSNPTKDFEALGYRGAQKLLILLFKKAQVNKRPNPHLFRHSRATLLAKKLTEAQMKGYFGWTQSSAMAARYVHLSGRDIDNAIMKINGIQTAIDEDEQLIKEVTCNRCTKKNPSLLKFCQRCGGALSTKIAIESQQDNKNTTLEFLQSMMDNIQKLQSAGVSLQEFNEFLKNWNENTKNSDKILGREKNAIISQ